MHQALKTPPRRRQNAIKTPSRHLKTRPRRPKTSPRGFQVAPKHPQEASKTPQDAPNTLPRHLKTPQMLRCVKNRPKCFPTHCLQYFVGSGPPNKAPKIAATSIDNRSQEPSMLRPILKAHQTPPRHPQDTLKTPQDTPKMTPRRFQEVPDAPRRAQDGPERRPREASKSPQNIPKRLPRRPKTLPTRSQDTSRRPKC